MSATARLAAEHSEGVSGWSRGAQGATELPHQAPQNTPAARAGDRSALPPVIILGGEANALSVARSIGRLGAKVYALNEPDACVRYSKYCQWLGAAGSTEKSWAEFLLGP